MKAALIYTSSTPELITLVEQEVRKNIGSEAELITRMDPTILEEVKQAGYVTPGAAARLIGMYMEAISQGADAVLNICSSVGEVADSVRLTSEYIGVPIVRIDEEMCREAVRMGNRVAVLATLRSTLEPTANTVKRAARSMGRQVQVVEGLADGAFGLNREQFKEMLIGEAQKFKDKADVIVLAQGSMAYVEEDITREVGIPTLSSPRFGAIQLKKALQAKGMI